MPTLSNWESVEKGGGRGAKKSDLRATGSAAQGSKAIRFERPQFMDEAMDNSDYYEASIYDGRSNFSNLCVKLSKIFLK